MANLMKWIMGTAMGGDSGVSISSDIGSDIGFSTFTLSKAHAASAPTVAKKVLAACDAAAKAALLAVGITVSTIPSASCCAAFIPLDQKCRAALANCHP
jgi:hypothetical protein